MNGMNNLPLRKFFILQKGDRMAGNILYYVYSGFLLVAWMVILAIVGKMKGFAAIPKALLLTTPLVVLGGFYYWNWDFNSYVKSYLFSNKVYTCDDSEELSHLSIPLPSRTVLKGKEDGCSPFYSTYANEKAFTAFYEEALAEMKSRKDIQAFHAVEQGFLLELRSGSIIDISLNEGHQSLSIDYKPKNK
ncbi:hypothetical protein [Paenibacillus xanthanilyticus]|uniref:Uncharacterized protein n=1 Tax=Paenibacillus xanthanilyticus TaxID=1783531 RepID=A0ABV8K9A0_9BACL